jgi:AmiR/NasT family two-component response regulator
VIEQAKGMIAEHGHLDLDEAFALLRSYSRANNRGLTAVAAAIVGGSLRIDTVATWRRS